MSEIVNLIASFNFLEDKIAYPSSNKEFVNSSVVANCENALRIIESHLFSFIILFNGLMIENLTMFLSELYTSSFLSKSLSILKLMVLIKISFPSLVNLLNLLSIISESNVIKLFLNDSSVKLVIFNLCNDNLLIRLENVETYLPLSSSGLLGINDKTSNNSEWFSFKPYLSSLENK